MSVTVEPIRPEERPACQNCGKGLQPGPRCRQTLDTLDGVKDPEAALAAFKTNRRVARVTRKWHTYYPPGRDAEPVRRLSSIEIVFAPDEHRDWDSYDGLFCTIACARAFARAAHRAGYRIKGATK